MPTELLGSGREERYDWIWVVGIYNNFKLPRTLKSLFSSRMSGVSQDKQETPQGKHDAPNEMSEIVKTKTHN